MYINPNVSIKLKKDYRSKVLKASDLVFGRSSVTNSDHGYIVNIFQELFFTLYFVYII